MKISTRAINALLKYFWWYRKMHLSLAKKYFTDSQGPLPYYFFPAGVVERGIADYLTILTNMTLLFVLGEVLCKTTQK